MCNRKWSRFRDVLFLAGLISFVFCLMCTSPVYGEKGDVPSAINEVLGDEVSKIIEACERNDCHGDFQLLVMAIRRAEWGPSEPRHLEWGIMDERANTYDKQCGWAAATVMKNYQRWQKTDKDISFIQFLGNRYCPVGCDTDNGTNRFWVKNVSHYYYLFGGQTIE